jgi:rhamnulokinase
LRLNFTNEGGVAGTTRFLKNVMGLWMLQCCRQSWTGQGQVYDYRELMELAGREPSFGHLVDPDDESFLRPADMPSTINQFCARTHQPSPSRPGAFVRAILESLALKYRVVLRNLEQVSGKHIEQIRVIGGGSKNRLLNQFTADATGKRVPPKQQLWEMSPFRFWRREALLPCRKYGPLWIGRSQPRFSNPLSPTSGKCRWRDSSSTPR